MDWLSPLFPWLDPVPGITVNCAVDHFIFPNRMVGSPNGHVAKFDG
jgi:hypothetical protein